MTSDLGRLRRRAPPLPPPASRPSRSRCASPTTAWSRSSRRGCIIIVDPTGVARGRGVRAGRDRGRVHLSQAGASRRRRPARRPRGRPSHGRARRRPRVGARRGGPARGARGASTTSDTTDRSQASPARHRANDSRLRRTRPMSSRCTSRRVRAPPRDARGSRTGETARACLLRARPSPPGGGTRSRRPAPRRR